MANLRNGYDETFLGEGVVVPMPQPGLEILNDVLYMEGLKENYIADYIHYSVVISKSNQQAFFSAANLDQKKFKEVSGRNWFIDTRIGVDNQIGPNAYYDNP